MRRTLLHLILIMLAIVAFSPADSAPEFAASMIARVIDSPDVTVTTSTIVQVSATAVTSPPPPSTTGTRWVSTNLEDVVRAAGLPPLFVDIARCESGSDPAAVHLNSNGSRDHGLWQINDRWWRPLFRSLDPYDPADNAVMAATVYAKQGLAAWEPSRHCWEPASPATPMVERNPSMRHADEQPSP